jgi:MvaI/BcnI restriction endonuclease family
VALELSEIKNLDTIKQLMDEKGVRSLIYKRLAPNDNSKNQIYLGGDYSSLQLLPFGQVSTDVSRKDSKRDRFKAGLAFYWLNADGQLHQAPSAQLILYPKYPEVRMSGFLEGAIARPSRYLGGREEGRTLILGITDDRRIIGHVLGPKNPANRELRQYDREGVMLNVLSRKDRDDEDDRAGLLNALRNISNMGWIDSFRLASDGSRIAYTAQNGGGYTLEGMLGVIPNGLNEPDYLGWELKQHKATSLERPLSGGSLTLMTPEPTGGIYRSEGVIEFIRRFGYPDTRGMPDRLNFGGVHKYGEVARLTGLTLQLLGYDANKKKIEDITGGIALVSDGGTHAAVWHFGALLEKWNRKHARAAYIPSASKQHGGGRQYRFGNVVALGTGTDFGRFLDALAKRIIFYDPGIKLENASSKKPKTKRRSQFRIKPKDLPGLYQEMEIVNLNES